MSYLYDIPDHPVIRNMERTGYPDGKAPTYPRCPICYEECSEVYKRDFEIIGCDNCVSRESLTEDDPEKCPMCDEPCEDTYYSADRELLGCEHCVTSHDAWQENDCFPQKDGW